MSRLVRVAGRSMTPTYEPGDVLLSRAAGRRRGPRRGDVIVLRHAGARMLKRVVALGGDEVQLEAGRLVVDGRSLGGRPRVAGAHVEVWRVPAGHYFVAGDAAHLSDDSRVWADPFVAVEDVDAVVIGRLSRRRAGRRALRPAATPVPAGRAGAPRPTAPARR